MTLLGKTTKTLGAVAIAGGAVLFASAPASAAPINPQGPYDSNCEYDGFTGLTFCEDKYATKEQCEDAEQWAVQNGARPGSALCIKYADEPWYTLQTAWDDDMAPRV